MLVNLNFYFTLGKQQEIAINQINKKAKKKFECSTFISQS